MDAKEVAERLLIEKLAMLDSAAGRRPFATDKQLSEWNGTALANMGPTGCPLQPNLADSWLSYEE